MAYILYNSQFDINSKLFELDNIIKHYISNDDLDSLILIVPTGKLIYNYRREIIKKYFNIYGKPCITPKIFNLRTFVTHCFGNLYHDCDFRIISEAYQKSLFEEAIEKAELNFFRINKRIKYALVDRLSDLIYGIKEDGITVEKINSEITEDNDLITDKLRFGDIHNIYRKYQELLSPNLYDLAEVYYKLNSELDERFINDDNFHSFMKSIVFPNQHSDAGTILVWGFSEFKTPEVHFLSHFGKSGIPTAIHLDFSEKNGPLFGNLSELTNSLTQAGYMGYSIDNSIDNNYQKLIPGDFFRKYLFAIETPEPYQKANESIAILEFETIDEEIDYIVDLVKYLISHENYKATDICVVTRNPSKYSDKFRENFYLKGLPVHISDRYDLASSPVVNSIFTVLSLIVNGFDKNDLLKTLSNKLLSIKYVHGNKEYTPNLSTIRKIASDLRIKGGNKFGGIKQWTARLEKAIEYNKIRLTKETDTMELMELAKFEISAENTLRDINNLETIFKPIPRELTIDEFTKIIKNDIIKHLKISINIANSFNRTRQEKSDSDYYEYIAIKEQTEKNAKALKSFLKILDELNDVSKIRHDKRKYKAEELVERLKTLVKAGKYQILDKINYGINVTSIEQIRGIDYKVSILCGANDGEFPIPYKADMLLGKKLNDSESRHENAERIQFYQFLTNAVNLLNNGDKLIFITHTNTDDSGEVVKSPFLTYLCKITGLKPLRVTQLSNDDIDSSRILKISKAPLNYLTNINDFYHNFNSDGEIPKFKNTTIPLNLDYLEKLVSFNFDDWISNNDDVIYLKTLPKIMRDVFSASEFEQYNKCPYQFYVSKLLKVDKFETKDALLSPLELGSLMHKILQLFYESLKYDKDSREYWVVPNPISDDLPDLAPINLTVTNREKYKSILFDIANETLNKFTVSPEMFKYEYDLLFGISDGSIYKKGLLEIWLDNELNKDDELKKYKPALFEYAFGMGNNPEPIRIKTQNGELKIKGKIDRVELTLEQNEAIFGFKVADYKMSLKSREHNVNSVKNGKNFQVPLYTKAAQSILEKNYGIKAKSDGAIYYRLNVPETKKDNYYLDLRHPEFDSIIEEALNNAVNIVSKVNSFEFPVKPVSGVCTYCNFKTLCRIHTKITADSETFSENES